MKLKEVNLGLTRLDERNKSVQSGYIIEREKIFHTSMRSRLMLLYQSDSQLGGDLLVRLYRIRFSGQRVNIFMPLVDAAPQLAPELGYDSRAAQ